MHTALELELDMTTKLLLFLFLSKNEEETLGYPMHPFVTVLGMNFSACKN